MKGVKKIRKIKSGGRLFNQRLIELLFINSTIDICDICGSPVNRGYICQFCGNDKPPEDEIIR